MSIKHVRDYYNQLRDDYREMLEDIHDLEEAVSNNIVPPEQLDQAKAQLETLITNYRRISYIMFLLDIPNKKSKQSKYIKANSKNIAEIEEKDRLLGIREENKEILKNFNNEIKNMSSNK